MMVFGIVQSHPCGKNEDAATMGHGGFKVREQASRDLCSACLNLAADGEHRDVVVLAEGFGRLGDIKGGLQTEVAEAVESEELARSHARLDHAVRMQEHAVARMEEEADFLVFDVSQNAKRQAAWDLDLLAVQVRG